MPKKSNHACDRNNPMLESFLKGSGEGSFSKKLLPPGNLISLKAHRYKDFANEITNLNIHEGDLRVESYIAHEHVKSNTGVRKNP